MKTIGIDLAGCPTNPSGFALLSSHTFKTRLLKSGKEIIDLCLREQPTLVAIDAPLSLPIHGNLRKADAELIKRGLRVFPPTFVGMRSLTERGIRLAKKLHARKIRVIEIHPRTSSMILFKTSDRNRWVKKLSRRGFRVEGGKSRHETDAAIAAFTGTFHVHGKTEESGRTKEGTIVIPLRTASPD